MTPRIFLELPPGARRRIEAAIESLIELLDALDVDADEEAEAETEGEQ